MKLDYHMHFEYGSYDEQWVKGFFDSAKAHRLDEIGISEHSHTFPEFKELYYQDLILDNSFVGTFQQQWLKKNKFKYTLDDYFNFIQKLRALGYKVKIGIEVCNFQNQDKVREILASYKFDYIIGSVHFLHGWAYDSSQIKDEWNNHDLKEIYEWYTQEVEKLCHSQIYDILGHPFNIRLFKNLPDFDVTPYLIRVAKALQKAHMAVDVNTGTYYRYPIQEISPYPDFMKIAHDYNLPIITSSDAHEPQHCGNYIDEAIAYAKSFGYTTCLQFNERKATITQLG
ncbi:histidinol-phosphatase [Megamonas hypermegale]|uniref:Histidinol-phosphatase n=1 Tax=Megamonas hypermegale TaxID=158847 RepID=A0A921HR13_9FIRM|nr:histidinol-phosphatase [Megamonas hypermegale]